MTERREDIADESKSRERFEKWWDSDECTHALATGDAKDFAKFAWQAAERDTRERCVEQVLALRDKTSTGAYWEALNTVAEAIRKGGE